MTLQELPMAYGKPINDLLQTKPNRVSYMRTWRDVSQAISPYRSAFHLEHLLGISFSLKVCPGSAK
jgi:hypothetical protein